MTTKDEFYAVMNYYANWCDKVNEELAANVEIEDEEKLVWLEVERKPNEFGEKRCYYSIRAGIDYCNLAGVVSYETETIDNPYLPVEDIKEKEVNHQYKLYSSVKCKNENNMPIINMLAERMGLNDACVSEEKVKYLAKVMCKLYGVDSDG